MNNHRAATLVSLLSLVTCSSASNPAAPFLGKPVEPGDIGSISPGHEVHVSCDRPAEGWLWCDDFEESRLDRYFEYAAANGAFERVDGVGLDGSWGMRATFQQGQRDAGSLKLALGATPQEYMKPVDSGQRHYRELYWRFWFRRDDDWKGGGGDKLTRATSFVSEQSWSQSMIAHVWSGKVPYDAYLVVDPASGTDPVTGLVLTEGYNDFANLRWLGAHRGSTPLYGPEDAGRWSCIEAYARLNDPGSANGEIEVWIDGESEIRTTGLNFVGWYDGYGINAVFLENYWNAGSPQTQSRYFDDFVVSTSRIGCGVSG